MTPQHAIIRRRADTGWTEPAITLAHVEVVFGADGVGRSKLGNSEKLPIECADAAKPYAAVLSVEIRDGDAHLVVPPTANRILRKPGTFADPPTFDMLYQAEGLDAGVARMVQTFHRGLADAGVWPYGRNAPDFNVLFANEIAAVQEDIPDDYRRLVATLQETRQRLEAAELRAEQLTVDLDSARQIAVRLEAENEKLRASPASASPASASPSAREARAAALKDLGADALRKIIRKHEIKGASSKTEMRKIILEHEFPTQE